ncbi:MAG TPA: amylo-alpha-1,6-glucosidase [Dictyobacter sp.]|jgi:predicted glycogen debranching enzyme|nr:amylo-alpha-1,6-glucosidase [Dictyobacter sp.]
MVLKQGISTPPHVCANAWHLHITSDICHDVQAALDREWLVTNGLGGYAAGSIVGATTRSYHGLLVATLKPPVERVVLVAKVDEELQLPDGQVVKLGVNEYQDGSFHPQGYLYLEAVSLEGDIPCFTYRVAEHLLLEKRIWMEYGQNITYVQYTLIDQRSGLSCHNEEQSADDDAFLLHLRPFCLSRDYHGTTQGSTHWRFYLEQQENRCRIQAYDGAPAYHLIADPSSTFTPTGEWYWHVRHRRESERGLSDTEDFYLPGIFTLHLEPGVPRAFVLSAETETTCCCGYGGIEHEEVVAQALMRHRLRVKHLLMVADRSTRKLQVRDAVFARLIVAADQFIVARPDYSNPAITHQPLRLTPERKTIIAGYPWFTDWGRDSMIALPGLLLSTGRYGEARGLLKAFASFAHHGLIPNRFPDNGEVPEYNTADATLWMFYAIDRYISMTGDWSLLKDIFVTLQTIIHYHVEGTDYGIGLDPDDGLLRAGVPGVQLTWMDARIGDAVVTPRWGKPVEINALWYYALTMMENWAVHLSVDATHYGQLRSQVRQHFVQRFWYQDGGYLYDVLDVEGTSGVHDTALRPNQLFAASLAYDLFTEEQLASILQKVTEHLLTPMGLRSLSPYDPAYHDHFAGSQQQRDSAYHQGTAWPWLIGVYIDVHLRIHNDRAALRPLLDALLRQLWHGCLGTLDEVAEPEPPYGMGGCFAQATSIAELLRCWLQVREVTK